MISERSRGVLFSPKTVEEVIRKEFQEVEEFEIVVERRGLMDDDHPQGRGESSSFRSRAIEQTKNRLLRRV